MITSALGLVITVAIATAGAPAPDYPAPSKAVCDARAATKVAIAVNVDAITPISDAVLARLTQGCFSLIPLDGANDDVDKAKAKGARVLVRLHATFTKTGTAKIDRANVGTYKARVTSRVVRVGDGAVLADISEGATLMGPNDDAAAATAGKRSPFNNGKEPLAWRVGDEIVRAIDVDLGVADGGNNAASTAACAKTTDVQLVDAAVPESAIVLRAALTERLAKRCLRALTTSASTSAPLRLEITLSSRQPQNSKLDAKTMKMIQLEWVLSATLKGKDGAALATESATSFGVLGVDEASTASNLVKDKKKLDAFLGALVAALAKAAAR